MIFLIIAPPRKLVLTPGTTINDTRIDLPTFITENAINVTVTTRTRSDIFTLQRLYNNLKYNPEVALNIQSYSDN